MGNSADSFKTNITLKEQAGRNFCHASDDTLTELTDKAEDLAITDNMRFEEALKIVSGQSRGPYGTNKL